MGFASGKNSWSLCDMCGLRFHYLDMRSNSYGSRVCFECDDKAYDLKIHPQNQQPQVLPDPQALHEPRPDTSLTASTSVASRGRRGFGAIFTRR